MQNKPETFSLASWCSLVPRLGVRGLGTRLVMEEASTPDEDPVVNEVPPACQHVGMGWYILYSLTCTPHLSHTHATYTNVGGRLSLPVSLQAPLPPTGEPLG